MLLSLSLFQATLFIQVNKSEGLRSRTWLSHQAHPPQPLKQGGDEEAVLVSVNHPDLDARRAEIQAFLRRAGKACEKVGETSTQREHIRIEYLSSCFL